MSSSQRDRTLSNSVELGTRQRVEYWFLRQGVPHFAQKYCYHERLLLLVLPMVILIAFELGVAEWSNLDTAQLFLVPPVVVALTAFSWPLISLPFEENPLRRLVSLRVALCVVVIGVAVVLLSRSGLPPLWSGAWTDFVTILIGLATATLISSPDCWRGTTRSATGVRVFLIGFTLTGVAVFAAADRLPGVTEWLDDALPWRHFVPYSVPALLFLLVILTLAAWLFVRAPLASPSQGVTLVLHGLGRPAVSALVLLTVFETAVLPWIYVGLTPTQEAAALFAAVAVLVIIPGARRRDTRTSNLTHLTATTAKDRLRAVVARPVPLAIGGTLYLFGYPALFALTDFWSDESRSVTVNWLDAEFYGAGAFSVLVGANALYFILAYVAVRFAVDRFAVWVVQVAGQIVKSASLGIARGIPLLLLFAGFLALTAETWQVSVLTPMHKFAGIVTLLLMPGLACLWAIAHHEIRSWSTFTSAQLRQELTTFADELEASRRTSSLSTDSAILTPGDVQTLTSWLPADDTTEVSAQLSWKGRANACTIMMAYELLAFGVLTAVAAAAYWAIGTLAVSRQVGTEWVYGDNASEAQQATFLGLGQSPWLRVAILLAVFSFLYLTVTVVTSPEQRSAFFVATEARLRRLLAVQAAYSCDPLRR